MTEATTITFGLTLVQSVPVGVYVAVADFNNLELFAGDNLLLEGGDPFLLQNTAQGFELPTQTLGRELDFTTTIGVDL